MNAAALTKSQHRVLEHLAAIRGPDDKARISTRALAAALALSRRTVQAAIDVLNQGFIQTWAGSRTEPSEHAIRCAFRLQTVPLVGGAILPEPCAKGAWGGGAISPESGGKPRPTGGAILPEGGAISQQNAQLALSFPQPLNKERAPARASDTSLHGEALLEEFAAPVDVTCRVGGGARGGAAAAEKPPAAAASDEIIDFVEILLSDDYRESPWGLPSAERITLDPLIRERFASLPQLVGRSPSEICTYLALNCRHKFTTRRGRYTITAGGLLSWALEDLQASPIAAPRRPPTFAASRSGARAGRVLYASAAGGSR